ncbi:hypothetical protein XENOCAPTIV_018816 [Xenoophorus captivus]|uniref:Guanylate kinase-like domain-containing protein n=1 Tax=Xenoophorus captivus TaxID=1517983 RepID=A0ABV0QJ34_9TELE
MYAFTSRTKMEVDIKNGRYLEYGEYEGNLYGLKIDSIHEVNCEESYAVCSLLQDEELQRTCDESAKIKAAFGHFFDLTIINENLDETYRTVKAALETVSKNPQWVPVTWVF